MTTHDEDKIIAQQARIEQLTNFIKYAQVSSGVCCCGDSMEGHPSPMTCGHSPVDMWDYHSGELLKAYPDDLSALRAHDAAIWREAAQLCRNVYAFTPEENDSYRCMKECEDRAEAIEKGCDK